MTRRADIRQWAALLLPTTRDPESGRMDLDRAITLAEALDARLAERGYPAADAASAPPVAARARQPKPAKPRAGTDHYAALDDRLRGHFDRLWQAYRLAKGKQAAAGAWATLAPDDTLAARIVAAAQADGRDAMDGGAKYPTGVARKYLQGWLSARAWEDAPAPGEDLDPAVERARALSARLAERRHLLEMHRAHPTPALAEQIERLDAQLRAEGVDLEPAREVARASPPRGPSPIADLLRRGAA